MLHGEPHRMAAEKLTRGRFAQIIIMLTLLIAAFIWRTIEHESMIKVACNTGEKCTFFVNESRFEIEVFENKMVLNTSEDNWSLVEPTQDVVKGNKTQSWVIKLSDPTEEISFKLRSKNESIEQSISIISF